MSFNLPEGNAQTPFWILLLFPEFSSYVREHGDAVERKGP